MKSTFCVVLSLYPPGVTAVLNDRPGLVGFVSLHTGAHANGDTLALGVLHQPRWALATWNARPQTRIVSGFVAAPAVCA